MTREDAQHSIAFVELVEAKAALQSPKHVDVSNSPEPEAEDTEETIVETAVITSTSTKEIVETVEDTFEEEHEETQGETVETFESTTRLNAKSRMTNSMTNKRCMMTMVNMTCVKGLMHYCANLEQSSMTL
jgi:hypothetical protein